MPLWLLSAAFSARKWASAGLSWLTASATHLLIVALACAVAWGALEHRGKAKWQEQARGAIAGREADRLATIAGQKQSAAKEAAARALQATTTKELAHANQLARNDAQSRAGDATSAYAASHRLPAQNACRAPNGTLAAGLSGDSKGDAGPGSAPDMVAVSQPDLNQLTSAAVRAASDRDFAQSLIDAGLAVAGE